MAEKKCCSVELHETEKGFCIEVVGEGDFKEKLAACLEACCCVKKEDKKDSSKSCC